MVERTERARDLRRSAPPAERRLWAILRNHKLDGFKFRRQVPIDRYFADFVCMEARLIVELDGSQHADQVTYDDARTRALERCGFRVVRFWNGSVLREPQSVIDTLLRELRQSPSP